VGGARLYLVIRPRLPPVGPGDAARRQIEVALAMIGAVDVQLRPLDEELRALARRQPGCRALMRHFGIGEITSISGVVYLALAALRACSRSGLLAGRAPAPPVARLMAAGSETRRAAR
jgi:transposase